MEAWDRVQLARLLERPSSLDYIENICDEFIEFHGDRLFGDDKSIVGGIGKIDKYIVTIIGEQKGRSTKENIERNFGMPNPEGYRKALRLMKQAEKFKRPIVTFIDTKRSICRNWSRRKRARRSHCEKLTRNVQVKGSNNMYYNWRRFKWRSFGNRSWR